MSESTAGNLKHTDAIERAPASVCALVVTHNRLSLLKQALGCIRAQTRLRDCLLVIDNGSTDGTLEWLDDQAGLKVIHQANTGIAGGVRAGLSWACEHGYTWTWINDDDAFPTPEALRTLLDATAEMPGGRVFNSLSIDNSDSSRIAFAFVHYPSGQKCRKRRYQVVRELLDVSEGPIIEGEAQFYQSSLIHREIVEKVGLPIAWLFIRGDEGEYSDRIIAAGYRHYTVLKSRVFHPQMHREQIRFLGRTMLYEPLTDLKRYYVARNAVWSDKHFPGVWGSPKLRWLRLVKIVAVHSAVIAKTVSGFQAKVASMRMLMAAISEACRVDRWGNVRSKRRGLSG